MRISEVFNEDCMVGMARYDDKAFDLAIVDPPFGIGQNWRKDKRAIFYKHKHDFNNVIPNEDYFLELFRVSRFQIIWGCNYYWNFLEPTNNLIFWDKGKDAFTQHGSAGELAWTNIKKHPFQKIFLIWNGACKCEIVTRIHPHQKPVKLYDWILFNYAEPGWSILDTHTGSGSSRISAHRLGFDFTGFELDSKYFADQETRFKNYVSQTRLF